MGPDSEVRRGKWRAWLAKSVYPALRPHPWSAPVLSSKQEAEPRSGLRQHLVQVSVVVFVICLLLSLAIYLFFYAPSYIRLAPGYITVKIKNFMGGSASKKATIITAAHFTRMLHKKARCELYPRTTDVKRFPVPDDKVPWKVPYPEYKPVLYTAPSVRSCPVWADQDYLEKPEPQPKWNKIDGKVNRTSHVGKYDIVDGVPRNPMGRTGIVGRGLLGRWGPNHAADPIVTRWKRGTNGDRQLGQDEKPILQFISVQRRDNKEWALPGGMVDAGEVVTATLRREFGEEALNTLEASSSEKKKIEQAIKELFQAGEEIYRGYVDDPRNTDNAWMETVAMNFHDDSGKGVAIFKLNAGDDAVGVQWMDISGALNLYASHVDFIKTVANRRGASW